MVLYNATFEKSVHLFSLFNYKFIPFLTKIIYFSIISNTFKRNYPKEDITNKSNY